VRRRSAGEVIDLAKQIVYRHGFVAEYATKRSDGGVGPRPDYGDIRLRRPAVDGSVEKDGHHLVEWCECHLQRRRLGVGEKRG
jgi:hypothetical protein